MSKKLCFLISFVLLFSLVGSTSAADKFDYRVCWWSDLGPGHLWSEPNNWWTMDKFYDDLDDSNGRDYMEPMWYVKEPNQVPDINCAAIIGKGGAREVYPLALREMILDGYVMTDPTFDANTWYAYYVQCGGGESFDPNVGGGATDPDANHDDPCRHHDFWMTGGTLNIGEPQTWDGYDVVEQWLIDIGSSIFNGQWSPGRFCIAVVPWGPDGASGTMHMSGGTVNVGGHVEVGAWGATGLLDMTGGEINIVQGFYCPSSSWSAVGHTNLHGGTINAKYLILQTREYSTGSIDIAGGKMVLERNEVQKIQDYFDGNVERASITVYGVSHGDIVTDDVNFPDANGLRVAFSLDYDVSNDGKTTVQAFTTDPCQAWAPDPPDGATAARGPAADVERPILSWSPGNGAVSHDVYFGTSFADVNSATTGSPESKEIAYDPCSYTVDSDLVSLGTYFWRIDENPGPVKGQVWDFTMANLSKAGLPSPEDGEEDVNPAVDLGWVPGIYASSHDVYFGTDYGDVNDANTLVDPNNVFMGNQGPNTFDTSNYDANGLEFNTTYYWRVDEVNDGNVWPASVWSFTTSDHITVDDMDLYGPDPAMRNVWKDVSTGTLDKNGAEVFVETNPDFVRDGNSMRYAYMNWEFNRDGPVLYYVGSEAEASIADLQAGTNWTASGVEALVLYFYGDAGNGTDQTSPITMNQMYVAVEDGDDPCGTGVVKYDTEHNYDMNDIKEASWHPWNIDLQDPCLADVNLANVVKVYIGFGGTEKTGQLEPGAGDLSLKYDTVWFDDIGLWPIRCVPEYTLATDFTEDCVVNEQDFDIMANDWLITDYNTLGYMGTLTGFPGPGEPNYDACWLSGPNVVVGTGALEFGGEHEFDPSSNNNDSDDYVKIPPLNLNTNTMSITVWVKRGAGGDQDDDGGIFFCSYLDDGDGVDETQSGFVMGQKGTDNLLGYNWQNTQSTWGWAPNLLTLPEDEWAFCALTVAPVGATIYQMYTSTGDIYSSENTGVSHDPEVFGIPSRIGDHKLRRFKGVMDDFRIYDITLNSSEIEYLAKQGALGTAPDDANHLYAHYDFDDATGLVAVDAAGDMVNWYPVPSQANLVDPEIEGERSVNFRDYVVLANDWLKETPWPPRP